MNRETLAKLLSPLLPALARYIASLPAPRETSVKQPQTNVNPAPVPNDPRAILNPTAPYDWSTPESVRHSVRVIADEEKLTPFQKNLMCQVLHCESGWNIHAINHNMRNGKVVSTDYGLCQWNDYYHGKEITPDEALNNPEKAVRLMCKYVKNGLIRQWVCYSADMYHKYTP